MEKQEEILQQHIESMQKLMSVNQQMLEAMKTSVDGLMQEFQSGIKQH